MSQHKARIVTTADGGYQVQVWAPGVGFVAYGPAYENKYEAISVAQSYLAARTHKPEVVWEKEV